MYNKLRRKHLLGATHTSGLPPTLLDIFDHAVFRTKVDTRTLLSALGMNSLKRFQVERRIKPSEFDYPALCQLHRLARHLPVPLATAAVTALINALHAKEYDVNTKVSHSSRANDEWPSGTGLHSPALRLPGAARAK